MDRELEIARMELELVKVSAAKAEQKFLIKQRLSEIKRLEEAIAVQEKREVELQDKITEDTKALKELANG